MEELDKSTSALFASGAPSLMPQLFATVIAAFGSFSMGTILGYSSPASPQLVDNTTHVSTLHITEEENIWFSSTMSLGALAGGPLGGILMKSLGRRGTMIIYILPYLTGWLLIAFAQNLGMLLSGRILTGLCLGISSLLVPTFIAEFSSPNIRGSLCSVAQLNLTLGILYSFTLGAALNHWPWLAVVCMLPPAMHSFGAIFVKESPYVLLSRGKKEEAKESLQFYRGKGYNVEKEIESMSDSLSAAAENKVHLKDLKEPHILKPLLVSLPLMFFQQFSGVNPITFNMIFIFKEAGSALSDELSSIIIAVIQAVSTVISIFLIDKAGRRILLLMGSGCMCLSLMGLGIFFYVKSGDSEMATMLGWLPFTTIIIFFTAFAIGFGATPWLILGELFPPEVKESAVSIGALINWSSSFIAVLTFEPLKLALGDSSAYFFYGIMNALSFVFCLLFVPETKGKSLEEIGALFGEKRRKPSAHPVEIFTIETTEHHYS